jgi:hypothetical protein
MANISALISAFLESFDFPWSFICMLSLLLILLYYLWHFHHDFVFNLLLLQIWLPCCDVLQHANQWTYEKNDALVRKMQERRDKKVIEGLWRGLVLPEEGVSKVDEQLLEELHEKTRQRSSVVESVVHSSGGSVKGKGKGKNKKNRKSK